MTCQPLLRLRPGTRLLVFITLPAVGLSGLGQVRGDVACVIGRPASRVGASKDDVVLPLG
jgi:hypothetical protein